MNIHNSILYISLVIMVSLCCCWSSQKTDQDTALREFREQVNETLPAIVPLIGIQTGDPVKVEMFTRAELGKFLLI